VSTTISLARGAPCPEALDADLIARCSAAALEADGVRVLSYGTGQGYPPLRERLAVEQGVEPSQVFITNGSLQAFVLLLNTHLSPGDRVAVEAPTYDRALLQLVRHRMEVLPVPVDEHGLVPEALAEACADGRAPRLLYTIPNFQNPSGATLSQERRQAVLELAERHGFLILEDDPYGRLRFSGPDLPGLFELGGPERVMFTSSFSKTVAPGLRVGYVVAPPEVSTALGAAANRTYISPSTLAQGAIEHLLAGGHFEACVRRVTGLMHERRDAMVAGLDQMPEGTRCVPPEGGFFCWLTLPEGLSADQLFGTARDAGVVYVKGSDCFLSGGERTLRLAYSGVGPDEVSEGMRRLGVVFRDAAATA
jgi:DNA-binding transcriptional MocR family regulator